MGNERHGDAKDCRDSRDEPVVPDALKHPIQPRKYSIAEYEIPHPDDEKPKRSRIVPSDVGYVVHWRNYIKISVCVHSGNFGIICVSDSPHKKKIGVLSGQDS